ncbi:hypothetical protein EDD16DRAFT_1526638 [Pisolithus croceorrhizus]|nr:hypothetical protein EDD16DRAFT_1526638 [Pisolithus croceorrhizus]KAI6124959.1 hypothetical protein EV401DRAFT_1886115 [Pisolithus croceorrhizus]KAI6161685.1 hypothetical protein EDD17DRAFT_1508801 [Pisolithus thermaeus]
MPTVNWVPPLPQSCATEHGCVTSDSQHSSSATPFPSSMLRDGGNPGSSPRNSGLMGSIEDPDHPEVLINDGIYNASTWSISEAQKASWAIACQQRAGKKVLLDNAMQEYLTQQTLKLEEIALKHSITLEYLKGVQWHNVLLHGKALEVNMAMVMDDKQLQNLMQEELEQYTTALNEHCDMKIHGV